MGNEGKLILEKSEENFTVWQLFHNLQHRKKKTFVVENRHSPAVVQGDSLSRCFKREKMREDKKEHFSGRVTDAMFAVLFSVQGVATEAMTSVLYYDSRTAFLH